MPRVNCSHEQSWSVKSRNWLNNYWQHYAIRNFKFWYILRNSIATFSELNQIAVNSPKSVEEAPNGSNFINIYLMEFVLRYTFGPNIWSFYGSFNKISRELHKMWRIILTRTYCSDLWSKIKHFRILRNPGDFKALQISRNKSSDFCILVVKMA